MPYFVDCECGKTYELRASAAGAEIACRCGLTFVAPRLSQMRRSAGEDAYAKNAMERATARIANGELPGPECCIISGMPTIDVLYVTVQCEQEWTRRPNNNVAMLLGALFSPWLAIAMRQRDKRPSSIHGRNSTLTLPLRIDRTEQPRLLKRHRWPAVKKLVAEHCEGLFEEYPEAKVIDVTNEAEGDA